LVSQSFPELIPDAPEKIVQLLATEPNLQAKRNAFLMLFHCDINRAVQYLDSVINQIPTFGESFQMVVLELIRKVKKVEN
jgi:coatomer subunit beta